MSSDLGARMRAARERAGMSRAEVHRQMVLLDPDGAPCPTWLTGLENGAQVHAAASRLLLFARAVGCELTELLGEPTAEPKGAA